MCLDKKGKKPLGKTNCIFHVSFCFEGLVRTSDLELAWEVSVKSVPEVIRFIVLGRSRWVWCLQTVGKRGVCRRTEETRKAHLLAKAKCQPLIFPSIFCVKRLQGGVKVGFIVVSV